MLAQLLRFVFLVHLQTILQNFCFEISKLSFANFQSFLLDFYSVVKFKFQGRMSKM